MQSSHHHLSWAAHSVRHALWPMCLPSCSMLPQKASPVLHLSYMVYLWTVLHGFYPFVTVTDCFLFLQPVFYSWKSFSTLAIRFLLQPMPTCPCPHHSVYVITCSLFSLAVLYSHRCSLVSPAVFSTSHTVMTLSTWASTYSLFFSYSQYFVFYLLGVPGPPCPTNDLPYHSCLNNDL